LHLYLLFAVPMPNSGHPCHRDHQKGLKREPRPARPRGKVHPRDLDVVDCHVDVGGENGDEKQCQSPARDVLNSTHRDQQTDTAQELKDAADLDAGAM